MKGDRITVTVRSDGRLLPTDIEASAAGRTVTAETEKDSGINWLVVKESTRGGTLCREARFQITEVVAWEKRSA